MGFQEAIRDGFDHYTNFDGRARRSAFWYWVLFAFLIGIVANIISMALFDSQILSYLVSLALFLPGLSVAIRRLHDTGRSGWWYLLVFIPLIGIIILIVWWVQDSDPAENEYGPSPKSAPAAA